METDEIIALGNESKPELGSYEQILDHVFCQH